MVKLSGESSCLWKARILSLSSTGTPLRAERLFLSEDTGKKEPEEANVGKNTSMDSMLVVDSTMGVIKEKDMLV